MLWQIIYYNFIGSIVSLSGGIILLWKGKKLTDNFSKYLLSFAIGVLLSVAFLDLLPEAVEQGLEKGVPVFSFTLAGLMVFFLLERFVVWFHHHHEGHGIHPTVLLLNIGDTLHNFIGGVGIGATFLADPKLGITTAIAVALHEIPQEISDFSLMVSTGMSRKYVLGINLVTALVSFAGAIGVYFIGSAIQPAIPALIAFTAGMFIYIDCSDLLPTLHEKLPKKEIFIQTALIFAGVFSVYYLRQLFEH
jgi:zinc and cadmium transporter